MSDPIVDLAWEQIPQAMAANDLHAIELWLVEQGIMGSAACFGLD